MSSSPHVLVDATAIPRNRGGVGRYLEHLLPALDAEGFRMTVAAQAHDAEWIATAAPNARIVVPSRVASRPARLLWEQFGLPGLARRERADVIFSPHYTMPVFSRRPVVVTLHDATFFSHPELHGRGKRLFFRSWIRYSLRHATSVVVPSVATRDEVVRWAHADPARIAVAYHGVNGAVFHEPTAAELSAARDLVGQPHWIGFLGTLEPRKNVSALVTAFADVASALAGKFPELSLALAGGSGWDTAVDGAIEASPVKHRISKLGFVADHDLAGFLGGSLAVAYPSLGEGFGLPVIEAMASGAPVVTTPFLALPEVGGDVAVYSQPDAASLATALTALLLDDADRAARGRAGITRAAEFGWDSSAQTHIAAFGKAAR